MPRYIDMDALIKILEAKAEMALGIPKQVFYSIANMVDKFHAADIVPRAEVDKWYHEYHAIKDELKQEKMYHRETEKLAGKYFNELQAAKAEVAREIFDEIDQLFERFYNDSFYSSGDLGYDIAELKKKYTEGS